MEVVNNSLKALNGPLRAILDLRLPSEYLLPLQDPAVELIQSLVVFAVILITAGLM